MRTGTTHTRMEAPVAAKRSDWSCRSFATVYHDDESRVRIQKRSVERAVWRWILGAVIFLGFAVMLTLVYVLGPSDDALIHQALDESVTASREGRAGGVLSRLTSNFTYNNEGIGSRADASKWIQSLKPEIFIYRRDIQREGDKAKIITPVEVSFEGGMKVNLENVNISFKRHTGSRYWLFPYADWQIESVTSDGFDPSSIIPMGLP